MNWIELINHCINWLYHCRYACPQFHNNKDRRRSPKKYKYRSTPCPNVKQGDEWGDPSNCDASDQCPYCHTRTEQQFHPEIYKSTKCNDIQQTGYCPRGAFCAFAHVESKKIVLLLLISVNKVTLHCPLSVVRCLLIDFVLSIKFLLPKWQSNIYSLICYSFVNVSI